MQRIWQVRIFVPANKTGTGFTDLKRTFVFESGEQADKFKNGATLRGWTIRGFAVDHIMTSEEAIAELETAARAS